MPEEKPPKRKSGPKPRTSHSPIVFHVSPELHQAMKAFATERKALLEELYREAAEHFLEQRAKAKITYLGAPKTSHGAQVYVMMADELRRRVRAAVAEDHQATANAFETALQLYFKHHGRSCP